MGGLIDNADRRRIAVLDATPVWHTRPVRGGDLYRNNPDAHPREDERRVLAKYGREASRFFAKYQFFGGVREVPPPLGQRLALARGIVTAGSGASNGGTTGAL